MSLNFPNAPTDGQVYSAEGVVYEWNASAGLWVVQSVTDPTAFLTIADAAATYLPLTGGTLTGALSFANGTQIRGPDATNTQRIALQWSSGAFQIGNSAYASQTFVGPWLFANFTEHNSGLKLPTGWTNDTTPRLQFGNNAGMDTDNAGTTLRLWVGGGVIASIVPGGTFQLNQNSNSNAWLQINRYGTGVDFISPAQGSNGVDTNFYRFIRGSDIKYQINMGGSASGANHVLNRADGDGRYQQSSSRRYKEDIENASPDHLVTMFDAMQPVQFRWGGELPDNDRRIGHTQYGFIAEDMLASGLQTFTSNVDENGDDTDGERVEGIDPLAMCAVLYAKIVQLEAQVAQLQSQNSGGAPVGTGGGTG